MAPYFASLCGKRPSLSSQPVLVLPFLNFMAKFL